MTRRTRMSAAFALFCVAALTLLGTTTASAQVTTPTPAPAGPTPRVINNPRMFPLPPADTQPESTVYDARSKSFYVSSSQGGSVSKVTYPQGVATTFLPSGTDRAGTPDGRTESDGVNIDTRNRLYVAGGSSGNLYVYDLATGRRVAQFNVNALVDAGPEAPFINDMAISPRNGDVYFTDSRRAAIYRVTAAQVAAGGGTPQVIRTSPETTSAPAGTNSAKPFNNNGIRFTPDGNYILFDDLNDAALYRLTPPPANNPAARQIIRVAVFNGSLGDADGLEFVGKTLYVTDNGGERILHVNLNRNFTAAVIVSAVTSPQFHTPTQAAAAPGNVLLVPQSQIFEPAVPPVPTTVDAIPQF